MLYIEGYKFTESLERKKFNPLVERVRRIILFKSLSPVKGHGAKLHSFGVTKKEKNGKRKETEKTKASKIKKLLPLVRTTGEDLASNSQYLRI